MVAPMNLRPAKLQHWLFLAGLLVTITVLALLWSVRGLGYPDPRDSTRPVHQFATDSTAERDRAVTRYSLMCLDSLSKAKAQDAIRYCDLAIKLDAQNVAVLNLRGAAHLSAGHGTRAIADFSRAIALAPGNPEAYRFRANVYATMHRDRLALTDYDRAVQLAPGDAINVELRGHFHQVRGRYALAIADFSSAIALQPARSRTWNSLCWTRLLANTNLSQAQADCDRALRLEPTNANALDSRGFVFLRLNRFVDAIDSFSKALNRSPTLASAWFGRGVAKLRIKDLTAPRDIARAKLLEPGIETRFLHYGIKIPPGGPPGM
jgi:tetratricopeptide (TPR) repeat protein